MNLLEDRLIDNSNENNLTISGFRRFQYDQLLPFCDHLINYISRLKNNSLTLIDKQLTQKNNYIGIHNSDASELKIIVKNTLAKDPNEEKTFLKLFIPTLHNDNFFFLNGITYVPGLYCIDYPIQSSSKLIRATGLITNFYILFKKEVIYFLGTNIPIHYFLQLFLDLTNNEDLFLYNEICKKENLSNKIYTDKELLDYFNTKTKFRFINYSKQDIIMFFENIFFDYYTYNLYKTCYNLPEVSIREILKKIFNDILNEVKKPHAADLSYKRIIFCELLLAPLFRKIIGIAVQSTKNFVTETIQIDLLAVLKFFLKTYDKKKSKEKGGLNGNYLYDTANLYSAILQSKISMILPGVDNIPLELQTIHQSHFGRICPITISSQDPAKMVSVILTTKLNQFGCFI